jgi:hypothetical protein
MRMSKPPFTVKIDKTNNRLYLERSVALTPGQMREFADHMYQAIASLEVPFDIIYDIGSAPVQSQETVEEGEKTQKRLSELGLGTSVLVVDSSIVKMQLIRAARRAGIPAERSLVASSIAEAEKLLSERRAK